VKYCIYALVDPRTDELFYIGQTSHLSRRRTEHLDGTDQLSGVRVAQIKVAGFLPYVIVLERRTDMASALSAEVFWIELALSRGMTLLNAQGVGGHVARRRERRSLHADLDAMTSAKRDAGTLATIANGRSLRMGETWSDQELRRLAGMVRAGMSREAMADALGRSPGDICRRLDLESRGTSKSRRRRGRRPRQ